MSGENIALFTYVDILNTGATYTTPVISLGGYVSTHTLIGTTKDVTLVTSYSGDGFNFDYSLTRNINPFSPGNNLINHPVIAKFIKMSIKNNDSTNANIRMYVYGTPKNSSVSATIDKIGNKNPEIDIGNFTTNAFNENSNFIITDQKSFDFNDIKGEFRDDPSSANFGIIFFPEWNIFSNYQGDIIAMGRYFNSSTNEKLGVVSCRLKQDGIPVGPNTTSDPAYINLYGPALGSSSYTSYRICFTATFSAPNINTSNFKMQSLAGIVDRKTTTNVITDIDNTPFTIGTGDSTEGYGFGIMGLKDNAESNYDFGLFAQNTRVPQSQWNVDKADGNYLLPNIIFYNSTDFKISTFEIDFFFGATTTVVFKVYDIASSMFKIVHIQKDKSYSDGTLNNTVRRINSHGFHPFTNYLYENGNSDIDDNIKGTISMIDFHVYTCNSNTSLRCPLPSNKIIFLTKEIATFTDNTETDLYWFSIQNPLDYNNEFLYRSWRITDFAIYASSGDTDVFKLHLKVFKYYNLTGTSFLLQQYNNIPFLLDDSGSLNSTTVNTVRIFDHGIGLKNGATLLYQPIMTKNSVIVYPGEILTIALNGNTANESGTLRLYISMVYDE